MHLLQDFQHLQNKEITTKQITKYLEKHLSKVDKLNENLEKIVNFSKALGEFNNINKK